MRKLAQFLFFASLVGAILFTGWWTDNWRVLESRDRPLEELATFVHDMLPAVYGIAVSVLVGYLFSFGGGKRSRPTVAIVIGFMALGMTLGVVGRALLSLYEFVRVEVPRMDALFWMCVASGGIVLPALVMAFETLNRWGWSSLAQSFDARGMAGLALACSRMSLLFDPGHNAMLRSVALARFRQGARAEVVDTLQQVYDEGHRDTDLIEALAKNARERNDTDRLLRHLRELCELNPGDQGIRRILLDTLVANSLWREALVMMEDLGVGNDPESLDCYATALLNEGHLEKAAAVARRLGEAEGIPFRLSQRQLRDILSRAGENVAALNTLAYQAEKMALRDQRLRWLEKSYEADSRQEEIRRALITLYRDSGDSDKLEALLADQVSHHPKDDDAVLQYALVMHKNEKSEEALQRLHTLTSRSAPLPAAQILQARIQFDSGHFPEARQTVKALLGTSVESNLREEAEGLLARIEKGMLSSEVAAAMDAAEAQPDNVPLQLEALAKLLEGSHPEKVIPLVDKTISRHPGSRDQVIDAIRKASARPDVPFPVLNLLADLLVARTRYDEALEVVRMMADRSIDKVGAMRDGAQKILRRSPHHLNTLRALGDRYMVYGRFTEMIHSYALYLSHGGEETEQIDEALAKAYLNLGDYENAKRFVNQLLAQKGNNVTLLMQVIPLALEADKPEEAAEYLKRLEIAAPRDPDMRKLKEKVSAGLGERRLAYLKKEMDAGRGDSSTLEQLGDVARSVGNYTDGITYYQRASRDRDNRALAKRCSVKLALCYTHKRLDDLASETLRDLTISLDDNPDDLAAIMDVLYEIGDLFLEMKLYAKAERVFKQLCKIDAGYRDVLAKVESLRV